jgi:hypothetical protein
MDASSGCEGPGKFNSSSGFFADTFYRTSFRTFSMLLILNDLFTIINGSAITELVH